LTAALLVWFLSRDPLAWTHFCCFGGHCGVARNVPERRRGPIFFLRVKHSSLCYYPHAQGTRGGVQFKAGAFASPSPTDDSTLACHSFTFHVWLPAFRRPAFRFVCCRRRGGDGSLIKPFACWSSSSAPWSICNDHSLHSNKSRRWAVSGRWDQQHDTSPVVQRTYSALGFVLVAGLVSST